MIVINQQYNETRARFIACPCRKLPLDDALSHHCMSHFHEASDVCTFHVVDESVGLCAVLDALLMDVVHDAMETLVNLFFAPRDVHSILAHFET